MRAATGDRFTAAVLRVERGGRAVFEQAYGTLDAAPAARAADVLTAFDLASITKVFVAAAVLAAVRDGCVGLDDAPLRVFHEWRGAHAAITPRMLLAHVAGMQSGADYRGLFDERVTAYALARPLVARPGERVVYSDLGFIALGVLLERACGASLAALLARTMRELGCEATRFRARNDAPEIVPATETDAWRGRVRGFVHDEKAYLMGGVAGHAGLFGTARDVAALAEAFLGPLHGRHSPLGSALASEAVREQGADPVLRRGLGVALKTTDENSCGAAMSRATFGHTGFTGTCFWSDPERDLTVVLLTNAVYFGRRDLRDVRAAICDACVAEFA